MSRWTDAVAYAARVAAYAALRRSVGASDEHRLFPLLPLSARPGLPPWPGERRPVSPAWAEVLASTRTRAFRVLRGGQVTLAWDAPGDAPERAGRLYSVSKSVLSLAWGLAAAEARVPGLDEVVHEGLSVRNLLRMDSGLGFDEGWARLNRQVLTYLHPDARRTARRARRDGPVGAEFHYNDFHSLLLGCLLEEGLAATGWRPSGEVREPVAAWIEERLLAPLGRRDAGGYVLDSARHRFPKTESGLVLSADDLLRVGALVLQGGLWQGRTLVPRAWIEASTSPASGWSGAAPFGRYRGLAWGPWLSTGRGFYAWHWWGRHEGQDAPTVFSLGVHGQILLVSPRHQAVVVRLADRWAYDGWWPDRIVDALDSGAL